MSSAENPQIPEAPPVAQGGGPATGVASAAKADATVDVAVSATSAQPAPAGRARPEQLPSPSMSGSASVQTGDIKDSTLNLTQILYDQAAQSRVTLFSWQEEHEEINQLNEINVSSRYVCDEAFADGLLATLNQHRFLLLTGEDDS